MLKGEDLVQVHSHSLSLIIGRDLRRNVLYACTIATKLAAEGKRVLYLNSYARPDTLKNCFQAGGVPTDDMWLGIADIPTGEYRHKEVAKMVEENAIDVVILNSLEFAGMSREIRQRVCRELVKLQQSFNMTLVVFSSDIKRDIEPGCATTGALGILAPIAEAISKIGDGWVQYQSVPLSDMMQERARALATAAGVHPTELIGS